MPPPSEAHKPPFDLTPDERIRLCRYYARRTTQAAIVAALCALVTLVLAIVVIVN